MANLGSHVIAAWIAHLAFWALLGIGVVSRDLGRKGAAVFVVLWLAGRFGLQYLPFGALVFPAVVALLDVVLVLVVFKGDVRFS